MNRPSIMEHKERSKNIVEVPVTKGELTADTVAAKDPEKAERQKAGETREDGRDTWGNQLEFLFSCLGYAVGFGNVWRFPYLAYKNGGAAFLIPYFIMLLCAGLPLFFMELALGQYISLGPNILFSKLAPIFHGLGWGMVMVSLLVAIYFNVIIAWSLFYLFASFTSELPWSNCNNDFNSLDCFDVDIARECLNLTMIYHHKECYNLTTYCDIGGLLPLNLTHCQDGSGNLFDVNTIVNSTRLTPSEDYFQNRMLGVTGTTWDNMGAMRWELVGCLALSWIIVGACMIKGVKSAGKVVYFTATFPYVILVILFGRGISLEGARLGIDFYFLKPNWSQLTNVEVWSDAATQIFYSLGSCFGCLITLSSYNKFTNNCMRDAIIIAFANCLTSVFAGFVIFSILGFLATELGVSIDQVASSGSGLAFMAYPAAVARMPIAPLWSILFFFMLITLGLGSQFSMVGTVVTALLDQFEYLRAKKSWVVFATCIVLFLMGLTMCLEGGVYMFELFFFYSSSLSVVILGIVEVIAVQYVYGFKNFFHNIREEMGIHMYRPIFGYWISTWVVVTPLALLLILVFSITFYVPAYWGPYVFPDGIQVLGWLLCMSSVVFIPLGTCYVIYKGKGSCHKLLRTSPDFCPKHIRNERMQRLNDFVEGIFNQAFHSDERESPVKFTKFAWKDHTPTVSPDAFRDRKDF